MKFDVTTSNMVRGVAWFHRSSAGDSPNPPGRLCRARFVFSRCGWQLSMGEARVAEPAGPHERLDGLVCPLRRLLAREQVARARLMATLVRWAILVTTFASALVELMIAVTNVTGAFLVACGALAACLVLAVGLGSKRGIELTRCMAKPGCGRQDQSGLPLSMNPSTGSIVRPGSSSWGTCPSPSNTTRRLPSISRANRWPDSNGIR